MPAHPDIFDTREDLGKPLLTSVVLHAAIFGTVAFLSLSSFGKTERWGDPHALGGGAVGITPVTSIPMPSRAGQTNPVANETESQIPIAPKSAPKAEPKESPDATKIKSKAELRKLAEQFERQHKFTPKDVRPNQVFSRSGQAVSSPIYSAKSGSGGVGSGSTAFGTRFGWYEQLLRERVARNWHSENIDARLGANPAVVTFTLMRDGSIQTPRVIQSSGNLALDQSALRAISISAPFPALPREYEHNSANLEFWFRLEK